MTTIFITIPWFSPAYKAGGPVQSIANMVTEFREEVQYKIFCSDSDLNGEILDDVVKDEWVAFNEYTEVWYATKGNRSNHLVQQIEKIAPDALFIIGVFSWHFNLVPLLFCKGKKILSARGMLHAGALAQKKTKKQFFLRLFKLSGLVKKVIFHATDELELQEIRKVFGEKVIIKKAGNFPKMIPARSGSSKEAGTLKMVTIALIGPMKNCLLVLESLANIAGNIQYDIYGPVKDMEYWQRCLKIIQLLPENIRVQYHGDIAPVMVAEKLRTSDVFVLPSESENYGHAIIEALSAGVPVITSHGTPWNQLKENEAGRNVATNAPAIAEAIKTFATMDQQQALQWNQGAAAYARAKVDIEAIREEYRQLFLIAH